jgi:hypothetical protein
MRIIKPYGRTVVEKVGSGRLARAVSLHPDPNRGVGSDNRQPVADFAASHERLVIAQWISTIDKIARKPAGDAKATPQQAEFRRRLGDAAWALIERRNLLPALNDPSGKAQLRRLWDFKIAPYETARAGAKTGTRPPPLKGRWFRRFAGDVDDVDKVDADAVAAAIHEHLYSAQYQMRVEDRTRLSGLIAARAESIAGNVLQPRAAARDKNGGWSEDDQRRYAAAGDVAGEIRSAAEARERGDGKTGPRRVTNEVAGAALYEHYARLFRGADGKAMGVAQARDRESGLFNLHMAVKDCYARILKGHGKDLPKHGESRRKVSTLLPRSSADLFRLLDAMLDNRDLNALVRLGKVIHYESAGAGADRPADVVDHWPADVADSEYWTSDGQARIKRNEALVRVWRHVLALASRTLTDWADPKGMIGGDILLKDSVETAIRSFDAESYKGKIEVLFGGRAALFDGDGDEAFQKDVLRFALEGVAQLRHAAFHFKGLGGFAEALKALGPRQDPRVAAAVDGLWRTDEEERGRRLLATMRGAHFESFFDERQNRRLAQALSRASDESLPLPRFAVMLRRAENAWGREGLPKTANRADLEAPARHCQYVALKLLYERPFRAWLAERDAATLNEFIDRAVARATKAARMLNPGASKELAEAINAKAADLGRLANDDSVEDFFFRLSAETAGEARVQRGYESDAVNAREQASHIENLKADLVALAFGAYLRKKDFEFALKLRGDEPLPTKPMCALDEADFVEGEASSAEPPCELYFLLHLVPVDEVGKLLHQLRKWQVLAPPEPAVTGGPTAAATVANIRSALELYLDMHDAKFEGGAALVGVEPFKRLFDGDGLFGRIFQQPADDRPGTEDDRRLPRRGLREIMRFGHLRPLLPIFDKQRIGSDEVAAFLAAEQVPDGGKSEIARQQQRREALHEKWARRRGEFSDEDRRAYEEALCFVEAHRHRAARVTLTDHVRLHRLLMTVLGRLADYAGLWERDLYFVTLALIQQAGRQPDAVFAADGLARLREGRIVQALRRLRDEAAGRALAAAVKRHFGDALDRSSRSVEIRNAFAHFNMLRPKGGGATAALDLTAAVNDGRELMAYDRKLRNAVSRSIAELLEREGLAVAWSVNEHRLEAARVSTRQASHLGPSGLREDLHGAGYVAMVAELFGGTAAKPADPPARRENRTARGGR